ncbi:gtp binding protein 4 [Ceraceosorus bombacis]|uniref:Nucleolar GTP-binding protein 1 n=1 Tax=Ceraceosorus bombacis TaxID=401625 RepID=A0A0P1BHN4_9BASI|nr:gtp binding protein 4 [Ceraceosorus bombacis]
MATFKASMAPVPSATQFLDIVLSKTQRRTPTVVHPGWKITRIRSFYMRKVMFTRDAFVEKLDAILTDFPILDNLHPFTSSLMNVLYDKNHYKLALGQLNTARHLIDQVAKDYTRLIKFGDSLYRTKQLKRAAMGRMATIMRRQKDPLAYLEQVRQHISRLPAIDPSTRTLLICGYPNVGKSSFINKVTRADVDVQPYAFTTKSLFVGHMDYKYLRWQVIDTPGILDHPLEEMNTIEMQSITALAHLRSAVLYFMDLSEQCGYTVEAQVALYHSIKPLFANKPTMLVINKIDVVKLESLEPSRAALVREIVEESDGKVQLAEISTFTEEGVMSARNAACDALLESRIEAKSRGGKVNSITNRLHVAQPKARDDLQRKPFIPEGFVAGKKYDKEDPNRRKLERDEQEERGGAGVHNMDMKKNYFIPEEESIMERLEELEQEEERLEQDGFYDVENEEEEDDEAREIREAAEEIRRRKEEARLASRERKHMKSRLQIPRKMQTRTLSEMEEKLRSLGIDPSSITARAELLAKAKGISLKAKRKRGGADDDDESMEVDAATKTHDEDAWSDDEQDGSMDVDGEAPGGKKRKGNTGKKLAALRGATAGVGSTTKSGGAITARAGAVRRPTKNRQTAGLAGKAQVEKARELKDLSLRERNRLAKAGESDRAIKEKMPKWLFAGKRGKGTSRSR